MKHLDLFSGIGGFALAADRVWPGITHTFCEIDPFCTQVLKKHWPDAEVHGDIRTLTNTKGGRRHHGKAEDKRSPTGAVNTSGDETFLLTGGFPCQPFSTAGRRAGTEDNRFLWPEMRRCVAEFRPRWVVAENVRGILSIEGGMVFEQVCADLEDLGYEVQTFVIPAAGVGAPHRRERVWFIAHANGERERAGRGAVQEAHGEHAERDDHAEPGDTTEHLHPHASNRRLQGGKQADGSKGPEYDDQFTHGRGGEWGRDWLEVATRLCRVDDGLPARVDGFELSKSAHRRERLKSLGNAIVPQVAEQIFHAIKDYDSLTLLT